MLNVNLAAFDWMLALALVLTAAGILLGRDLFRSIVLFMLFGLLLTLAWCRLDAVDVALAEAGIGAGLTGAILLNAWAGSERPQAPRPQINAAQRLQSPSDQPTLEPTINQPSAGGRMKSHEVVFTVSLSSAFVLFGGAMAAIVVPIAGAENHPRIIIDQGIPLSGVTHPVTAVLLNFRSYDTLLEVAVLLSAAFAVLPLAATKAITDQTAGSYQHRWTTEPSDTPYAFDTPNALGDPVRPASSAVGRTAIAQGPILRAFVSVIVPITTLVAAYLLLAGTKAPGGAFQSAALLSAIGVLVIASGLRSPAWTSLRWRVLKSFGLMIFVIVGITGFLTGNNFLYLQPQYAGATIFLVELSLAISLAATLVHLFICTSPGDAESPSLMIESLSTTDPPDGPQS
jgi:multisubunit Na+/H+ antiporter MnhB subunit